MPDSFNVYREKNVTEFQIEGAKFLAEGVQSATPAYKRALLLDEMRVGKTPAVIVAADSIGAESVLWLTLGSARKGHADDWKRFTDMDREFNVMLDGKAKVNPHGVNITSFDLAAGSLWPVLSKHRFDLLVGDELHNFKNPTAKRTKAFFGPKIDGQGGYTSRADVCWGLTGTLMPRNPAEVWPVLHAWFPKAITFDGKVLTYEQFVKRFCKFYMMGTNYYNRRRVITGGKNLDELKEILRPLYLRRKFADVAKDVPLPTVSEVAVKPSLPRELRDDDAEFLKELEKAAKESRDPIKIMETLADDQRTRLRRLLALTKVPGVARLVLSELSRSPGKIVIFYYHTDVGDFLKKRLSVFNPAQLGGGLTPRAKFAAQDKFKNNEMCRVFLGQYRAAGAGIDLSVADDWLAAEPDYSYADIEQAMKRVMNLFKQRQVRMRFAMAEGSMDAHIVKSYRQKLTESVHLFG